jgi:hypothetical protein
MEQVNYCCIIIQNQSDLTMIDILSCNMKLIRYVISMILSYWKGLFMKTMVLAKYRDVLEYPCLAEAHLPTG